MTTGLAKQFKQVLDTQVKRARETADGPKLRPPKGAAKGGPPER